MGAAAHGDWCAAIGQVLGSGRDGLTTHLAKRLGKVQALIPRIRGLPFRRTMEKGRHKARMMLTKVAMNALDYDAKLIPSPILTELTRETHVLMDNAMCAILGCELEEGRKGALGGLERAAPATGRTAYWATWHLHAQVIPQLATKLGRVVMNVADGDPAEQARQRPGKAGICARQKATLKLTEDATRAYQSSPWKEKDVAEIFGHTTERDYQPARELFVASPTHTRLLGRCG